MTPIQSPTKTFHAITHFLTIATYITQTSVSITLYWMTNCALIQNLTRGYPSVVNSVIDSCLVTLQREDIG